MEDDPIRQPMHGESKGLMVRSTIVLLIVLVVATALFFWSFSTYRSVAHEESSNVIVSEDPKPSAPIKNDTQKNIHTELLKKIEAHITLPTGEEAEVSIVNDAEVLKESQPFFEKVEVGDILVLYEDFAIIYREIDDSIVNSGKVDNSTEDPDEEVSNLPTDAPGADVSVEIRNGTAITGYAGRTKDELVTLAYTIAGIGNAAKTSYEETVVVRKISVKGVAVTALEDLYGVSAIIDLPEGERTTSADILVILGGSE
mgnify:CR=1 FL=1